VSIDIADAYGPLFLAVLFSADRRSDSATARGVAFVKTPASSSSARLSRVTRPDHRFVDAAMLHLALARRQAPCRLPGDGAWDLRRGGGRNSVGDALARKGTAAKSSIGDGGIPTMLGILPARAASAAEAP